MLLFILENQASTLQSIEKRNLTESRIRAEIPSKSCLRILHMYRHTRTRVTPHHPALSITKHIILASATQT